ncbi:lipopolysaccharide export system permease protein [Nitratiruptor sp. YY09-18]|nr:lipopolysaccharide export system permease protein [Nitratiruptor sp. YY09-18]
MPQILFFSIPVVFFAAAVAMLKKLSFEYESIALFSVAISPHTITNTLLKVAFWTSVLLATISLLIIPQAKQMYKGFIYLKEARAQLNLKPSELGHKFGDWYIYVGAKKKNSYKDVSLYHKTDKEEHFIVAKSAKIVHSSDSFALELFDGNTYTLDNNKLKQITFDTMTIYDNSKKRYLIYADPFSYWAIAAKNHQRAFDLTLFLLISLFPLAAIYIAAILGIYNPRFEVKGSFFYALFALLLYFSLSFVLAKKFTILALIFFPLWLLGSFLLFNKVIAKRY